MSARRTIPVPPTGTDTSDGRPQVLLLDRRGCAVFHGDPGQAEEYFVGLGYPRIPLHENVPDRLLDIVMGEQRRGQRRRPALPPASKHTRGKGAIRGVGLAVYGTLGDPPMCASSLCWIPG